MLSVHRDDHTARPGMFPAPMHSPLTETRILKPNDAMPPALLSVVSENLCRPLPSAAQTGLATQRATPASRKSATRPWSIPWRGVPVVHPWQRAWATGALASSLSKIEPWYRRGCCRPSMGPPTTRPSPLSFSPPFPRGVQSESCVRRAATGRSSFGICPTTGTLAVSVAAGTEEISTAQRIYLHLRCSSSTATKTTPRLQRLPIWGDLGYYSEFPTAKK